MTTTKGRELRAVDLETGSDALLEIGAAKFAPSIDNAGDWILYGTGDPVQVRLARPNGSGSAGRMASFGS